MGFSYAGYLLKEKIKMSTDSEADDLIDGLKDNSEGLSGWEHDFIQSLEEQRTAGKHLTDKQLQTLYNIWDTVMN